MDNTKEIIKELETIINSARHIQQLEPDGFSSYCATVGRPLDLDVLIELTETQLAIHSDILNGRIFYDE